MSFGELNEFKIQKGEQYRGRRQNLATTAGKGKCKSDAITEGKPENHGDYYHYCSLDNRCDIL